MPALIYSPEVTIHIARADGQIVDVSDDLVRGQVVREINGVSRIGFTMLNAGRKYDGMFTPMDRVVVYMRRIKRMLVFSGYLDSVPVFGAYAGSISLQASCTLKRLQHFMWDPNTSMAEQLFASTRVTASMSDGGLAKRTIDLLNKVAGWPKAQIHIGAVPHDWFERVSKVAEALVKEAEKNQMISEVGGIGYLNGESPASGMDQVDGIGPGTGHLPGQVGRISWFGGPNGAAYGNMGLTGESGSHPRDEWYCAMRWPYAAQTGRGAPVPVKGITPAQLNAAVQWWKNRRVLVVNPKNNKAVCLRAADWGPGVTTGRTIDVSQFALSALGASTDDVVHIAFAPAGTDLGVQTTNAASVEAGNALKNKGVTDTINFPSKNPRSPRQAISWAISQKGASVQQGICMHWCGEVYGYGSSGWPSPEGAWPGLPASHKHPGDRHPPPGALLWYASNSAYGHIVVYLGGGNMASTDYPTSGKIGIAPVRDIERDWGHTYLGWTDPYFPNGSRSGVNGGKLNNDTSTIGTDVGLDTKDPQPVTDPGSGGEGDGSETVAPMGMSDVGVALFNVYQWIGTSNFGGDLLTGIRALMNDEPILNTVNNYMSSGLRHYCSAPNGDFIAWFPDYFGHYKTAAKMVIQDIEIEQSFAVAWSDGSLKTHMFVTSSSTGFEGMGDASATYQQLTTAGIASVEFPELMKALFNTDKDLFVNGGKNFLNRFGARPWNEEMNNITGGRQEFFFACQKFMQNWAEQYSAQVSMTFMPELYPGMLAVFPRYGVQAYVQRVTHTFDMMSEGFTTTPDLIGWSTVGNRGIQGLPRGAAL